MKFYDHKYFNLHDFAHNLHISDDKILYERFLILVLLQYKLRQNKQFLQFFSLEFEFLRLKFISTEESLNPYKKLFIFHTVVNQDTDTTFCELRLLKPNDVVFQVSFEINHWKHIHVSFKKLIETHNVNIELQVDCKKFRHITFKGHKDCRASFKKLTFGASNQIIK